jgi:integrase
MSQTRQAKILTDAQIERMLAAVEANRYPLRDRVIVLLSVRAGLRAKEVANVTWAMVLDAEGRVGHELELVDKASKGKRGGRIVPLHRDLRAALTDLARLLEPHRGARIIAGERDGTVRPESIQIFFARLYASLALKGCSSHSGRRTFVTRAARKIVEAGGSLRDVQQLAGHQSLATTQRYIEGSTEAKRKVIDLL